MKLSAIAESLGARLVGDGSLEIDRAVHPAEAEAPCDLALAMDRTMLGLLGDSAARVAVVFEGAEMEIPEDRFDGLVFVPRPRYAMAGLMRLFERPVHAYDGIHPSAVVESDATLGEGVSVGACAYVGPKADIGPNTIIMPQATVGAAARIGADCLIHPGVRIGERVVVGDRVIIHHNASIGADGFSFVTPEPGSVETAKASGRVEATNTALVRINSIGTVILGDDVEVGACTAIDRGTVSATRIGNNTKIDDLVMIGHNCIVGENCMLCGQVGIAGSCTVGDRVVLAGQVGVADHVAIGSDVVVGGGSGVAKDIPAKSVYLGYPAMPKARAAEQLLNLNRLRSVFSDMTDLKKRLKSIETLLQRH